MHNHQSPSSLASVLGICHHKTARKDGGVATAGCLQGDWEDEFWKGDLEAI